MSYIESRSDCSNQSSPASDTSRESSDDNSDNFVFRDEFLPYQEEPLANTSSEDEGSEDGGEDEDGISRTVLEGRYLKEISLEQWCTCGSCNHSLLVGSREFRCCKEIVEASGKFTFEGLNAGCILSHTDFNPLTNKTVLLQVGPLLKNKSGKRYTKYGHTENEFLRAVAYRWLTRWLFGEMGWENTRPLSACIYHHIRSKYITKNSKGYVSGQERANETD